MGSIISIEELCKALGVEYDRSKSSAYYLHMVKDYRFHYESAQQSVQLDGEYCTCKFASFVEIVSGEICRFCNRPRR